MTLPVSGPISLADLQTEFGGSDPTGLTEYYRGGGLVSPSAATAGIPESGAISLQDFYGKENIPLLSVNLKWSGAISNGATLDAAGFVTTPYSTLLVIQWYSTGGEPFYYPPTTQLNGVDMPLIINSYSNALDDGRGISVSTQSVASGDAATITWTSAYSGTGYVYEVLGFRDMAAAVHAITNNRALTSNNVSISRTTVVNVSSDGAVLLVCADGIGTTTPFEQYTTDLHIGWDTNPASGDVTYSGGNRLNVAISFDLNLA